VPSFLSTVSLNVTLFLIVAVPWMIGRVCSFSELLLWGPGLSEILAAGAGACVFFSVEAHCSLFFASSNRVTPIEATTRHNTAVPIIIAIPPPNAVKAAALLKTAPPMTLFNMLPV